MIIYTVKPGDTVFSVAQAYNTSVGQLSADNSIDPSLPLVPGQNLLILYPTQVYTVKEGDTVSSVAEAFNTSKIAIWQNNPSLKGSGIIYPGQTIVIKRQPPEGGEISVSGYAYTYIDDSQLRSVLPYLTYISVFPFGITEQGSIISPEGDERLVRTAREYDAIPLLSLTSLTEEGVFSSDLVNQVLSSQDISQKVIDNTVNAVISKGYGGVDMDFEFIDPNLADEYAAFIDRLKASLGDGYTVFADLAPKTFASQPGLLYEAHNYPLLGAAADYLFLMTYEWGYMYGPPLAVSPVNNVRSVIEYAISEIPSDKLFMGLPSYGYDWPLPFVKGQTKAESISPDEAVALARRTGTSILYDESAMAPYFYYSKDSVEHVVWFQEARSADSLARLAFAYSLGGIGIWNLMRPFPQLYPLLSSLYSIKKM